MAKITIIGAGSTVFTCHLLSDILSFPELAESEIALLDIDPERLADAEVVAQKVARGQGAKPKILATLDSRRALEGADYIINSIQVGGYKPGTVIDFEIPKKYGLRQTIADTLGIGGIMRALRTIPVILDYCRQMEELCPGVTFLNYVNPMAMNMMAILRATKIRSVGLCHSVQGTAKCLAQDIGVPYEEINYLCAGINHMAFYLRFERDGEDLYPRIRQVVAEGRVLDWNRVRYEMLMRLGYFVTESSEHFSEYCPHFIRRDRPDLIERFNVPLDEYIRRCEEQIAGWEKTRRELSAPDSELKLARSHEYGPLIIHSMETGEPRVFYGNVLNHDLITNLPNGCCVEVPCLVDGNGIQPTRIGELPPQLAAIMRTNINPQELAVAAVLTGKREHVYHAAMLDPHTAAELTLDEIWRLVDDLLGAHGDWIPAPLRAK
ncbi:MAG: alpha-glucosidase/alpha-galactosidase [Candidatus Sumerlaeaceae bacterium]|nr:alpha-glucosidase/alpha-galactosidase [Candidatus Sumerlaeaceae bacterium]